MNSTAEEYKLEIEGGFWWQAEYQDADPTLGEPTQVLVTIDYRSEEGWEGTFRVEYRVGTTVLKSAFLPVDSSKDEATGKGLKGHVIWDLSSVVQTVFSLNNGRVRFINNASNGKKIWASYSVTNATLGGEGGGVSPDTSPPNAPTALTATAVSQSRIDLAWQVAQDPQSGVASHKVYRDDVLVATVSGSAISFSDTGLSSSTRFDYRVSGVNGVDLEGALSTIATATTLNAPPVAVNDSITLPEGGATIKDVLANDIDPDGGTLTIISVNNGAGPGTATSNGVNITYTHNGSESLNDNFTYTISDGQGGTDTATVTVTVIPVNDAPVAIDDSAVTAAGSAKTINVLDNDLDPDSSLTVTNLTQPAVGTGSVIIVDNAVTYTPPTPGFTGTANFSYTAFDGEYYSNVATVSVDVGLAQNITLTVTDGWDQKNEKTLVADAKLYVVQDNDNDWWETLSGYFTRFELGGDAVPEGATVTSVKVYFEYWQEEDIDLNTLMWHATNGTIALEDTDPLASIIATTTALDRLGEEQEGGGDAPWEICDEPGVTCTADLVNDLKIVIENMDTEGKKALLDKMWVEVTFSP